MKSLDFMLCCWFWNHVCLLCSFACMPSLCAYIRHPKTEIRNCSSYTLLHFETHCIRILITASCCSRTSTLEQMKTALASETISSSLAAFSVSQYAFSVIFCLSRQVDGPGFLKETSEPIKWSSNQGMLSMLEVRE